jgi:hypothetical protein
MQCWTASALPRHPPDRPPAAAASLESEAWPNEADLKLIRARGIQCRSRANFFALRAQIIRRILVDHARHRRDASHGGDAVRVPLDEAILGTRVRDVDVLFPTMPSGRYPNWMIARAGSWN